MLGRLIQRGRTPWQHLGSILAASNALGVRSLSPPGPSPARLMCARRDSNPQPSDP